MERFDIDVFEGDKFIAAKRSVALRDSMDAWPKIAEVARQFSKPGTQIRVTNEAGEIIILVGVKVMQMYSAQWR